MAHVWFAEYQTADGKWHRSEGIAPTRTRCVMERTIRGFVNPARVSKYVRVEPKPRARRKK